MVASAVEAGTPAARLTKTTRAASPPLAGSTLLSPEPAKEARMASPIERAPIGRRNTHQLSAFTARPRKFTTTAAASRRGSAERTARRVVGQSTLRARTTRSASVATVRARRSACLVRGVTRRPRAGSGAVERRVRRREARDRHAEGRAGHVVEPQPVAERHGARLAAVLAADADLEVRPGGATLRHREADQLAHAGLVEHLERVVGEDAAVDVARQKAPGVVAAQAERRLREVVRA